MRRLRWPSHEASLPSHPYRDSAIIYACLAAIIVVIGVSPQEPGQGDAAGRCVLRRRHGI